MPIIQDDNQYRELGWLIEALRRSIITIEAEITNDTPSNPSYFTRQGELMAYQAILAMILEGSWRNLTPKD